MTGGPEFPVAAPVPRRILKVCLGNYCRSPLAAAVLAQHGGSAVEARSAGIVDKWVGGPAHPAMIDAAAAHGYDLTRHRAVQVSPALMAWADLILAMDHSILATLRDLADDHTAAKLALYLDDQDVADPYGQDEQAFAVCVEVIERGAWRHLA
ncbi:low molecular weight protein-tyrosine-phosphatase [Streptomyces sp. H39-C1]|uniref:low molecular weight protein-tyrosine-phosphatase n=1 Tax=Streptomyces sp. H39-C1 TaxID=3004355 RepID=UPI0022AFECE7|nr:low molecular weight protein-tyrosine-phosphatase [Streptomyces sp. H39-C1]MCZ4098070.1 low molecular weight phosphotyrosine protein phosphatase [Streptomyces sp. H39-C1]